MLVYIILIASVTQQEIGTILEKTSIDHPINISLSHAGEPQLLIAGLLVIKTRQKAIQRAEFESQSLRASHQKLKKRKGWSRFLQQSRESVGQRLKLTRDLLLSQRGRNAPSNRPSHSCRRLRRTFAALPRTWSFQNWGKTFLTDPSHMTEWGQKGCCCCFEKKKQKNPKRTGNFTIKLPNGKKYPESKAAAWF